MMRQPKLGGFSRPRKITYEACNIALFEELPAGTYTIADLVGKRLVRKGHAVKLLAHGTLTKKITVEAHAASKAAKDAVKKAGGEVKIVPMR